MRIYEGMCCEVVRLYRVVYSLYYYYTTTILPLCLLHILTDYAIPDHSQTIYLNDPMIPIPSLPADIKSGISESVFVSCP